MCLNLLSLYNHSYLESIFVYVTCNDYLYLNYVLELELQFLNFVNKQTHKDSLKIVNIQLSQQNRIQMKNFCLFQYIKFSNPLYILRNDNISFHLAAILVKANHDPFSVLPNFGHPVASGKSRFSTVLKVLGTILSTYRVPAK